MFIDGVSASGNRKYFIWFALSFYDLISSIAAVRINIDCNS